MKRIEPPIFLQTILLALLPERDRETVSGDLYEEFVEVKVKEVGRTRARFWYAGEVLSFVPQKAAALLLHGPALMLVCGFTALAASWLGMMDFILQHRGYLGQMGIAAAIIVQALLTMAALRFHRFAGLRVLAMVGSVGLLWLAASALKSMLAGPDMEGYILLIALAMIVQALLTLLTLPRARAEWGKSA